MRLAILLILTAPFAWPTLGCAVDRSVPLGRLPDNVEPKRYRLDFALDAGGDRFVGRTEIVVNIVATTRQIWLHGNQLKVRSAFAIDAQGTRILARYEQVDELGVARLTMASDLGPGEVSLHFDYDGPVRSEGYGAGLSRMEYSGHSYLATMMFPTAARSVFPCFDEPRFKTPFEVTIVVPAGRVAISNAPPVLTAPAGSSSTRVTFAATRPIATYLVGFWVGDYERTPVATLIPSAVRPEALAVQGFAERGRAAKLDYALKNSAPVVAALEAHTGVPYPFGQLNLIAIPDPAERGGMENAGAPSFGAYDLLVDERTALIGRRGADYLLAHEIAHQWFGNLVTPAWWNDFWLNEAFATRLGHRLTALHEPSRDFDRMSQRWAIADMDVDSSISARAIRPRIETTADMRGGLNQLMYGKGNGLLAMLEAHVGSQAFQRGVQTYLRQFADQTVTTEDFIQVFEQGSSAQRIGPMLRSFLDQPGVPQLEVDWRCEEHTLTVDVAQSRYAMLGSAVKRDQKWVLPFCISAVRSDEMLVHCSVLENTHSAVRWEVDRCPSAILPNANGAGYFRFNLPREKMLALAARVHEFGATEALTLADAVGASYKAGHLDDRDYLSILQPLASHPAWDVAVAPLERLQFILEHLPAGAVRDRTRQFVGAAYAEKLRALGVHNTSQLDRAHPDEAAQLREALIPFLALHVRDRALRDELRDLAETDTPNLPRDSAISRTSMIVIAQDSGESHFDTLVRRLGHPNDPAAREAILQAIGSNEIPSLAAKARQLTLATEMEAQDALVILGAQAHSPENRDALWAWQKQNLRPLMLRFQGGWRRGLIRIAAEQCSNRARIDIERTLAPFIADIPGGRDTLEAALDRVGSCAALSARFSNADR